jgi:uncharacterized protein YbaA (DUF1428 family)
MTYLRTLSKNKNQKMISKNKEYPSRSASDPYQLKYMSEDELKNEFERIRNQNLEL